MSKKRNTGKIVIQAKCKQPNPELTGLWEDVECPRIKDKYGEFVDIQTTDDAMKWIAAEGNTDTTYRVIKHMKTVTVAVETTRKISEVK